LSAAYSAPLGAISRIDSSLHRCRHAEPFRFPASEQRATCHRRLPAWNDHVGVSYVLAKSAVSNIVFNYICVLVVEPRHSGSVPRLSGSPPTNVSAAGVGESKGLISPFAASFRIGHRSPHRHPVLPRSKPGYAPTFAHCTRSARLSGSSTKSPATHFSPNESSGSSSVASSPARFTFWTTPSWSYRQVRTLGNPDTSSRSIVRTE